jgi:hypothetical protein
MVVSVFEWIAVLEFLGQLFMSLVSHPDRMKSAKPGTGNSSGRETPSVAEALFDDE